MNMNDNIKSHFIKCNCYTHMLECKRYNYDNISDQGFQFTIWNYGHEGEKIWKWKDRIRWCWRILKTGNPWADNIVATNESAHELANYILENLPKII